LEDISEGWEEQEEGEDLQGVEDLDDFFEGAREILVTITKAMTILDVPMIVMFLHVHTFQKTTEGASKEDDLRYC